MTVKSYVVRSTEHAGHGLFCQARIEANEVIETFHHYISAQGILETDARICQHLKTLDFEALPALNEKLILTIYLALHSSTPEDAENREARSIIHALPQAIQNGVWSDLDLSQTELAQAIHSKQRALHQQWSALASEICDFDVWKWADSIVTSRSIGLSGARIDGGQATSFVCSKFPEAASLEIFDFTSTPDIVLVPVLDLCNHAGVKRNARWELRHPSKELILISERAIDEGDEITISYGDDKTNTELFFNYGFTLPDNPNWSFLVSLDAPSSQAAGVDDGSTPEDYSEWQAQYWSMCKAKYGIGPVIRFHSESPPSAGRIDSLGDSAKPILSEAQIAAILLSLDAKYLDDLAALVEATSRPGSEVFRHLLRHMARKAAFLTGFIHPAARNELRTRLLREERDACRTVGERLDRWIAAKSM